MKQHRPLCISTEYGCSGLFLVSGVDEGKQYMVSKFCHGLVEYTLDAILKQLSNRNASDYNIKQYVRPYYMDNYIESNLNNASDELLSEIVRIETGLFEYILEYVLETSIDIGYGVYRVDTNISKAIFAITFEYDYRIYEWEQLNSKEAKEEVIINSDIIEARNKVIVKVRTILSLMPSNATRPVVWQPNLDYIDTLHNAYVRSNANLYDIIGKELRPEDIDLTDNRTGGLIEITLSEAVMLMKDVEVLAELDEYLDVLKQKLI